MKELIIKVDTNDADINTKVSQISDEDLKKIKPLIGAIKKFKPYTVQLKGFKWTHTHNYHIGEYVRIDLGEKPVTELYPQFPEEVHELLQSFCPYGENGFHTIESITVSPLVEKNKLL
jgi:hypothetical protein